MESRHRSRRLVTHGSAVHNKSQSKTVLPHTSTIKNTQTRTYHQHHSNHHLSHGEKKEEQSRGLGLDGDSEDKIYDIPSSDEEKQQYKPRRKRLRYDSNRQSVTLQQDIVSSRQPTVVKTDVKPDGISAKKQNPTAPLINTASLHRRKGTLGGQGRPEKSGNAGPGKPKPRAATPTERLGMTRRLDSTSARENKLPDNAEVQKVICSNEQPGLKSPSFPRCTLSGVGNRTPGRRRLIDSLGTRERSVEGSPSDIPTDSMSSFLAPLTPTRQSELAPSRTPVKSQCDSHGQDNTAAPSPHLRGSKVTYARQRSFLDDLMLENGPSGVDLVASVDQNDRLNSNNGPRARLFTIEEPDNDDGTVRSIHELRQAGGNARYRGAIESIFEDIEDAHISSSGRCNALVQLCSKLLDSKLARQFLECSFDKRLVNLFSMDLDLTSSSLALCAYSLCAIGRPLPYTLATTAWPKLLDISLPMLDVQDDLFTMIRAPRRNISKGTQLSIQQIIPQLQSTLLPDTHMTKLSPCFLALQCLKTTIAAVQEKGENSIGLSVPFLQRLLSLMLSTHSHHGEFATTVGSQASQNLISGLSILEAHTTSVGSLGDDHRRVLSSIASLYGLISPRGNSSMNPANHTIQSLYIRVILNVTNSHPGLCDDFATPEMIGELAAIAITNFSNLPKDPLVQNNNNSLDTVILALGALINLTEQSEISRIMFLNTGSTGPSLLDQLLELFLAHVDSTSEAHSVPAVHHNVAVGYLAVLLLVLCLNPNACVQVKNSLHTKGLSVIMSTVEEFLQYHRKIEQEMQPLPVQGDSSGFYVRLHELMGRIQQTVE
ncbi:hypothetical protein N7520_005123 [Penicillium odoratum]|uniref:uncharacterized protein n=1 Tax=Penicillium odoratum TaxID=1167516 RepID=UPI002548B67B|nr:uncharacterized protein N7520_005123 [Penicillium odoratum]KAJ5765564.1 hypothetical protein N7520_005123 [Penicillium odoratum]